jgi:hypothetical protein
MFPFTWKWNKVVGLVSRKGHVLLNKQVMTHDTSPLAEVCRK